MFGQMVGKSAMEVQNDLCDQLIDSDNKTLRDKLRTSMRNVNKNYSTWITGLNQENTPCNEFGLYLLCHVYKWHVVIVLSSKLWCSFKVSNMTMFEQINKTDHILVWLGEDKYGEIKPLQVKSGIGNVQEWQQLSESVNHMHEKRLSAKTQRRPEHSTASVQSFAQAPTPATNQKSPQPTRKWAKCDSSVLIDYKQYHTDRIRASKSPQTAKPLPVPQDHQLQDWLHNK